MYVVRMMVQFGTRVTQLARISTTKTVIRGVVAIALKLLSYSFLAVEELSKEKKVSP
jgi:hypothetical protein